MAAHVLRLTVFLVAAGTAGRGWQTPRPSELALLNRHRVENLAIFSDRVAMRRHRLVKR
jgi:hypothetical protein